MTLEARQILIAEDTTPIRLILEHFLKRAGFHVECVRDGADADRLVQEREFDLLITDFMMPRLTGVQLIKRMRARGDTTPVLLVSGTVRAASLAAARRYGAVDIMEKPFSKDKLLQKVETMLAFHQGGGHRAI